MVTAVELKIPALTVADRSALPQVLPVRQILDERRVADVPAAVSAELARPEIRGVIRPGQRIAVGVGSRGITGYREVICQVIAELRAAGAEPFVVPAMGGHGRGTAQGQLEVFAANGITEATVGAPIYPTVDTIQLGTLDDGTPIHFDAVAARADGVVVINRIKPHTQFRGPVESGLTKMIVAGLGKAAGVAALHRRGTDHFHEILPRALELILARVPVLFGVGLVANGHSEVAHVEAVPAPALATREPELLRQAFASMANLMFDDIDVLVLARFGKDVSGQGADPNVIGRNLRLIPVFGGPRVKRIVALDLTDASHGNASGLGQIDMITERFARKIDFTTTYSNVVPTTCLDGAALPIVARTDADAIAIAITSIAGRRPAEVRTVYIRDTAHLATIYVSESLRDHVESHPRLEVVGPPRPLVDGDDALPLE